MRWPTPSSAAARGMGGKGGSGERAVVRARSPAGLGSGIGYDAHRFAPGRRLVLGGVEIAHEQGLAGHSDADVLLHAIADAVLGAAALGDIGQHFPPSDERFRDADSQDLLREAVRLAREAGWVPGNVDATVLAEAPRIGPHVPLMRERIAACLGVAGRRQGESDDERGDGGHRPRRGDRRAGDGDARSGSGRPGALAVRVLAQRVSRARVTVAGETIGEIGPGFLLLVGVTPTTPPPRRSSWRARWRTCASSTMRRAISIARRSISWRPGSRSGCSSSRSSPSTPIAAKDAAPASSTPRRRPSPNRWSIVSRTDLRELGLPVATGRFGAEMEVELVNDGPVTIWLDSAEL